MGPPTAFYNIIYEYFSCRPWIGTRLSVVQSCNLPRNSIMALQKRCQYNFISEYFHSRSWNGTRLLVVQSYNHARNSILPSPKAVSRALISIFMAGPEREQGSQMCNLVSSVYHRSNHQDTFCKEVPFFPVSCDFNNSLSILQHVSIGGSHMSWQWSRRVR